ncbi:acylphosphatase [Shewanella sp. JM162201]|uniref:acylphosphatase n=1 Tax=Shewanella jiangmenensis TaxID=2837387 RepID=A0ABS5V008_9GAMM|nr:acylphosphatase [Shewanella jiangmenensis]MBT1443096.1 acylphosphatase [Shewanella jiangmenensis]
MRSAIIHVLGKVQGVCFRRFTLEAARDIGITGYVTNLSDGSVEILAQGSDVRVARLIEWCWQGSPLAKVTAVEVKDVEAEEIYLDFSILQS